MTRRPLLIALGERCSRMGPPLAALAAPSVLALLAGCSGAPLPTDLERAQQLEAGHRNDAEALAAWTAIRASCPRPDARPRDDCGLAATREAQLLEEMGRDREAVAAWEALPSRSGRADRAALGFARAAEITLEKLDDPAAAAALAWRCVETYPDEVPTKDALALALRVDGERDPKGTMERLDALAKRFPKEEIADHLVFAAAGLARKLDDPAGAVARYDDLALRYPHSGLADDANFRAAEIVRARGDARGALGRLQRILDTKRKALIVGSYNEILLDDSQLMAGQILRDDLHDRPAALKAFQKLVDDYPDSNLRDDALLEIAHTWLGAHTPPTDEDRAAACGAFDTLLQRFPDGNRARAAQKEQRDLSCPTPSR